MSVRSNELRIGNWVWSDRDDDVGFIQITASQLASMYEAEIRCSELFIEPLNLTRHNISSAGFSLTTCYWMKFEDRFGNMHSFELNEIDPGEWTVYYRNFNKGKMDDYVQFPEKIRYVHQLQNIYFAMYGVELNIVI